MIRSAPARPLAAAALAALAAACTPAWTPPPAAGPATPASATAASTATAPRPSTAGPHTRAERTGYLETSRYADVVAFLDSLRAGGAAIHLDTLGFSPQGRAIPLVIASRPLVRTPEEARRLGRPIVYVQGNIHAGEVEGKEAVQALLRDLTLDPRPNVLDSVVLVAVPIYNADGNERFAAQAVNREEQNGPERVGERANGQGLDLNRDYVKAEAPETRASLAAFARWDPDVFVDLHTTDGSYHGYALTYAPSLTPAAGAAGALTRDVLLPELRRRMRARHGFETFDYGNFTLGYGDDVNTDTVKPGWYSYDHRPRFGTNYVGLRGRVSILSEAFSHDPFERRVASTYAFVREILSLAAERGRELAALRRAQPARDVAIRSILIPHPPRGPVIAEDLAATGDSSLTQPGVPRGLRRTGRFRTLSIPVADRFVPTLTRRMPAAYALAPDATDAVRLLALHGLRVDTLRAPWRVRGEAFAVDSVVRSPREFQRHHEVRLVGRWTEVDRVVPAGWLVVRTGQPLATLAAYLLEPESDDGLATWNVFDAALRPGGEFPVLRVLEPAGR
ncbi:MAG: peptidase carboxypeptidase [Gemmatimonadetes bacterium]|nr:peptidase carboxypeptidase [Gemmatimonadota bacterium]